jgi:hypothetical protein
VTAADDGKCAVGRALDGLDETDRADLQAALDNTISSVVLAHWFTEVRTFEGCSTAAVTKHRKGECSCG